MTARCKGQKQGEPGGGNDNRYRQKGSIFWFSPSKGEKGRGVIRKETESWRGQNN